MTARGRLSEIDRPAAVRAIDGLDVPPQLRDLLRRERADEVLLPEEIEEGLEPAVIVRAPEVLEPGGTLQVLRPAQPPLAARTLHEVRVLEHRSGDVLADQPEQRQRRPRRELQVLSGVEPDGLARVAQVNLDGAAEMSIEDV